MTTLVVGPHPDVVVVGKGGRFGVLPAEFPTGGDFPSPLENDAPVGGWLSTDEVTWRLESVAAGGTVVADDFGGWERTGAPNGTYVSTYRIWYARAGVVTSATYTITDTIGDGIAFSLSATDEADALSSAMSVVVGAALSLTDGQDSAASASSITVAAAFVATDSADQLSSAGTVVSGVSVDFAATDAQDALASSGLIFVSSSFSVTDSADVFLSEVTASGALWPNESDVRLGVSYGPTGTEFTGTLVAGVAAGSFLDVSSGRRVRVANGVAITL